MTESQTSFQSALVAGAVAGMTVDLCLFPLDTIKTRLQSSSGFFASGGFSEIYRGVGSALVGSAPASAIFFCTYEGTKSILHDRLKQYSSNPAVDSAVHLVAGSAGEVAVCTFRVPTEVVKQRAQAGQHQGSSKMALLAILKGYKTHGLDKVRSELYRGWGLTVLRDVPFTAIQFPLWEAMKAWGGREDGNVSAGDSAVYGSVAGGIAAGLTTPLDVVKTRVVLSKRSVAVSEMVRHIAREEGFRPFFLGIVPRVTWISIGGAVFLGTYQLALNTVAGLRWTRQSEKRDRSAMQRHAI